MLDEPTTLDGGVRTTGTSRRSGHRGAMAPHAAPRTSDPLLPELLPGEDVWATLALPTMTLLATDRRLLTRSAGQVQVWDYDAITQVGPAGIEGDVVISFQDGRPLVVHTRGDETAMQALTVIGLLVAQSRRLERLRSIRR